MIGLDTNLLVRYIVQDDLDQARVATAILESQCTVEDPGFVNCIVLCELVWVLESSYRYPKNLIAQKIEDLLKVGELEIEDRDEAWSALQIYRRE